MNSYDKIRNAVFNLCEKYASEIAGLYDNAIMEISELMKGVELDEEQPFNFEDYGLQEKVDDIMDRLEASVMKKVGDGVLAAYAMSYKNCEELVRRVVGEKVGEDVRKAFLPKIRSNKAAKAFMKNVPSISGRLWNGETLALMTSAVEDGISQGMSAKKMASRIKEYLNDPNDWHRRFRYKIGEDEDGNSVFGRKWKKREWDESEKRYKWVDHKPGEPHPGHVGGPGAYRSSYKNALRYTRTTINIAYRTADYDQYQSLPFVRGIEILLSNNHPIPDICDDLAGVYPKDFKWTGWHPNCRCYQVPLLAKAEEVDKMVDSILDGGEPDEVDVHDVVNDLPDNFKKWAKDNEDRIVSSAERGTLPYFIRDNQKMLDKANINVGMDITERKNIENARVIFNRYDQSLWSHSYINSSNGGSIIEENSRISKSKINKQEEDKYKKEKLMCKFLADNGHTIEFRDDTAHGAESFDILIDGMKADLKKTGSANNIIKYARHATKEQGAEVVVFGFTKKTKQILQKLTELKRKGFKFYYYFEDENVLHKQL